MAVVSLCPGRARPVHRVVPQVLLRATETATAAESKAELEHDARFIDIVSGLYVDGRFNRMNYLDSMLKDDAYFFRSFPSSAAAQGYLQLVGSPASLRDSCASWCWNSCATCAGGHVWL